MNPFKRLAAYVLRDELQTRASKAGKLISMAQPSDVVWTPREYDKFAEESYEKNAVAFRAINEIAKCIGSVPYTLFDGPDRETRKEIKDPGHPLLRILERPNPLQSRAQFMWSLIGFFMIAGNTYVERVGPMRGAPRELWPKRPDRMTIKKNNTTGMPAKYQFRAASGLVEWNVSPIDGKSNILHIRSFHPTDDWYGLSPVEAAAFSVDQHNEAGKWNMKLLQNSARPSGALVIDPKAGTGLEDIQFDRLREQIREQTGPEYAGQPLLLEGGMDWKEMGFSPVDMDWLQAKHTSARDIAMVFGMPSQMLGIPGDNTHRNMEEARLWLWEQTIIPMLDFFTTEFNWWLTPLFGENLHLEPNLDNVAALIPRRFQLWEKIQMSDFLTVNEQREAVGYEPRDEGDVIRTPGKDVNLGDEPEDPAVAADTKAGFIPDKGKGKLKVVDK